MNVATNASEKQIARDQRAAFRAVLKKAIDQKDRASVLAALEDRRAALDGVTSALLCAAAKTHDVAMVKAVADGCTTLVLVAAARSVFIKGDRLTTMTLARGGGHQVVDELVKLVSLSEGVGLMTELVDTLREQGHMAGMLGSALSRAAEGGHWNMFRFLLRVVPTDVIQNETAELLNAMVCDPDVPFDLLRKGLAWLKPGGTEDVDRGTLLVFAARYGCTQTLPLILNEGVAGRRVIEALMDAACRGDTQVMGALIPRVSMEEVILEFLRQMDTPDKASRAPKLPGLRRGLDEMARVLDPGALIFLAERLKGEPTPIISARMREIRAQHSGSPLEKGNRRARRRA